MTTGNQANTFTSITSFVLADGTTLKSILSKPETEKKQDPRQVELVAKQVIGKVNAALLETESTQLDLMIQFENHLEHSMNNPSAFKPEKLWELSLKYEGTGTKGVFYKNLLEKFNG